MAFPNVEKIDERKGIKESKNLKTRERKGSPGRDERVQMINGMPVVNKEG